MEKSAVDVSILSLGVFYAMLLVPITIMYILKIKLIRRLLFSVARMTLQLFMVGLYLSFIFNLNAVWLNALYLLLMISAASFSVLINASLSLKKFFFSLAIGMSVSSAFILIPLLSLVIKPFPVYDARYLIPMGGMILGNCLRSNVVSLERFYSSITKEKDKYLTSLMLGSTYHEARLPYIRQALQAAISPMISTVATMGLVSLPGMMTGQILGGSEPSVAIKYQILIMLAIFSSMLISSTLNLFLSTKVSFNAYGMPKEDIFRGSTQT